MALLRRKTEKTPLDGVDAVLVDLDGVVYQGADAIPYAVDSLNRAQNSVSIGYVTNNASRTASAVAQQLNGLGLNTSPEEIITSPQVAVRILATLVPLHSVVHIVGGNGLVDEAEKAGFSVTHVSGDRPAAVLQGFSPTVAWTDLAEAAFSLHTGIPWIATNMDWTIPVPGGVAPGNGTLVSAVHTAVGRLPIIAGKPEVAIFEEARQRFHSASPLFVGDRLDTDILGANRAGMTAALVLTGIDGPKQLLAADKTMRPTYIVRDLRELHSPYPVTRFTKDKTIATVGRSTVRLQGNTVEIDNEGDSEVDLLRAACAVIWNSGRAIYGLSVPERLYASSVTPK